MIVGKQKTQASAAFLGVYGIPRKVVGMCCIPTTNLADSGVSYVRYHTSAVEKGGPCESVFACRQPSVLHDSTRPMKQRKGAAACSSRGPFDCQPYRRLVVVLAVA
jgi:hypothetical protein